MSKVAPAVQGSQKSLLMCCAYTVKINVAESPREKRKHFACLGNVCVYCFHFYFHLGGYSVIGLCLSIPWKLDVVLPAVVL